MNKNKKQENGQSNSKLEVNRNDKIIQKQEAGDASRQIQVGTVLVQQGIDEKRVREIFGELYNNTKKELTEDAISVANQRVIEFENTLMPKVLSIEGAMEAFADPGFQKLLSKAHSSAIATSKKEDYELLTELLIHRVQNKEDRIKYTGISKAIEIIDYVDDDALLGMTVAHAVGQLVPNDNNVRAGLIILDNLFGRLIDDDLPCGRGWIEHLDLLDCVRLNPISSLKRLEDYYSEQMDGYVCTGIKADSEEFTQVKEVLASNKIPLNIMRENPLLEGYYIVNLVSSSKVDNLYIVHNNDRIPFSDEQKECIRKIFDMYDKNMTENEAVKQNFIKEIDALGNLKIVREWWNNIPIAFDITASGRVLAHANAMRMDSDIPPLDQ